MRLQQSMLVLGENLERTTANAKADTALAVDSNCSCYQTRVIGELYDSALEHPIVVLHISSSQHQPRIGAQVLRDLV